MMSTASYNITHEYCDANALPAEITSVSSLEFNTFYKICPGTVRAANTTNDDGDGGANYAPLGQPRCGDGSNYSFLFTRPAKEEEQQEPKQGDKILIELAGGGACWDDLTCTLRQSWLAFPPWPNEMLGGSCLEEYPDFLCAKTFGEGLTEFSTYNSIFIPYCTQDVHLGDTTNITYRSDGTKVIQHVGAHNIYRTLQWVFENFPNPSHVFLTGCSAGGTPLPVVYDLINTYYTSMGHTVDIDIMSDSPVFLTPSYFLDNLLPNWNFNTIMDEIGFDFETYKDLETFPDEILDYALRRSKTGTDKMGMTTHDADLVSLSYYVLMKGPLFGNRERRRRVQSETQIEWWNKLNSSMSDKAIKYANFDFFVNEGNGHCSFGLNDPLAFSGFENWASTIIQEDDITPPPPPTTISPVGPSSPAPQATPAPASLATSRDVSYNILTITTVTLLTWRSFASSP